MENHQGKYLDTTNIELEPTYIYRDEDIITPSLGKENAVKIMTRYTYFKSDSKQIKIFYYAFTTPKFNRVLHVNKDKYSGLVSIDEGKREYIRKALLLWAEVANIEFIEIPENEINKGDITFSAFKLAATPLELRDSENEEYGSADKEYVTDDYEESVTVGFTFWGESEIWLNDAGNILADLSPQSDAQVTVLHEIGHVLGLNHPFYDNNVLKNNTKLPITHYDNTIQYSLMSYTSEYLSTASFLTDEENEENGKKIEEDDHHDLKVRCPSGPQLYDVATIQYLYGANHKTRTGDDIYGFNGNTGHSFLTLENEKQQIVHCIWDADGNDTLDFSGYSVDQIIDLRPGHFSCVGGLYYNTSITFNTFIENAIGGSGDDYLKGNKGNNTLKGESGNDELEGGAGADDLWGGNGYDIYIYSSTHDSTSTSTDTLHDFESGKDKIDLSEILLPNSDVTVVKNASSGSQTEILQKYDDINHITYLMIDFDQNKYECDMMIKLTGRHQLSLNDFIFTPQIIT